MTTAGELDGRTARAVRTREAIVDACIALVDDGDLRPTAPRVAERAGVSVRSVFQHFDDLETMFAAVADRFVERLGHLRLPLDVSAPLAVRLPEIVRQRALVLEAITPIRRAATIHEPFSAEIRRRLRAGHDFLRSEIERFFAPELRGRDAADRAQLLDALDVALAWTTWEGLRGLNGRSVDEARVVLERMVAGLLRA